jgi:succinate dehydrogenase/fumarate reductase cytochrome b subunit
MAEFYKYVLLIISVICGVLSFLPFLCHYHIPRYDDSSVDGINSQLVEKMNFSMIIASILLLFESLLDWNTLLLTIDFSLPRWVLIFGCLLTSLMFYCYEPANDQLRLEVCVCCFYARSCFFSGSLLFQIEMQPSFLSRLSGIFLQFFLLISIQLYLWKSFFRVGLAMEAISSCFAAIAGLVCIYFLLRTTYSYGVRPLFSDIDAPNSLKKFRFVIASCCGIKIFGDFITTLSFGSKSWSETTSHEILCYFIMDLFIFVFVYHVPGRMAHADAASLQFQLQSKRAFVRYVGHEIRTPLNTVTLGLDLLQANITSYLEKFAAAAPSDPCSSSSLTILSQISQMVSEVSDSSTIAIDILNDMLLYDKVEEGNIVIYPEKIIANQLLSSLVSNFSIQVRHFPP